jgi:CxxC motif-containing protein
MEREVICLGCPNGCHLLCEQQSGGAVIVTGHGCERGLEYGREEILEPKRMVTAVVRTNAAAFPFVPVKTEKPLVKALIPDLLRALYRLEVALPVAMGDKVIDNFQGSGVGVVFTRTVRP